MVAYRAGTYQGMPRTSYIKSGQWVRRHLSLSKEDHVAVANDYLKNASRLYDLYYQHIQRELKFLASKGVDPGPLISGVVSEKFLPSIKDALRTQIRVINDLVDAAMGHYAAAGKRVTTYRAAYRSLVGGS
jgi:hypothetical protein